MTKVIGVRFRTAGKIYYFSPGKFEIKQGDHVIVETARGVEYGKVVIGTFHPDMMEDYIEKDDLVILGNRAEDQLCAIEMDASCIIVGLGAKVSRTIQKLAEEKSCVIISTPHDTYTIARLINQSIPIKYLMKKENLITFSTEDFLDEIKEVMKTQRHRDFPVLDKKGKYVGTISRRNLIGGSRKRLILVDHNEESQAVDNVDQAEILEIIDHHRIGNLETTGPVYFRNVPVGCTATILYQMFGEQGMTPSKEIAGLLLSAILSDTLMFRSPTSTPQDEAAAKALAALAGEDIPTYAEQMFEAGADLTGRDAEDVFCSDFKVFSRGDAKFGVGQSIYMTDKSRAAAEALVGPFLPEASRREGLPMIFYMFTDMKTQSTDLMYCGNAAEQIVREAFHVEPKDGKAWLPGVVSRKKQLIPPLLAALQAHQE